MNDEANVMDFAAIGGVVATLAGWLPSIAAVFSIIWLLIRIIESDTFRAIVKAVRPEKIQIPVQDLPLAPDPIEKEKKHGSNSEAD